MRKSLAGLAGAAAMALSLIGASGAAAFTEVGNECTATTTTPATLLQVQKSPASALPVSAPTDGVATRWRVNLPGNAVLSTPLPERLIVFRSLGGAEFQAIADSSAELLHVGQNAFDTRIPVHAGDRFGAYGSAGTVSCESPEASDVVG